MESVQVAQIVMAGSILCFAIIGSAFSMAYLGASFLQSVARQPEMANALMGRMFVVVGLIDAMPFIGFAMSISFYNPFTG